MRLYCPRCGAMVPAGEMDLSAGWARCRRCDNVFNIRQRMAEQQRSASAASADEPIIPRPPRIHIEEYGGTWRASWRWFSWFYVMLVFFCIAWDSFLIVWYAIAIDTEACLMLVFPIAHVAAGVWLTYLALTGLLNRTVVEVSGGTLSIRHGPLPWPGNRTIPGTEIAQLYCQMAGNRTPNMTGRWTYHLSAVLKDGQQVKLLGGFQDPDEPRFLERQLEQRLRILPRPVAGEVA